MVVELNELMARRRCMDDYQKGIHDNARGEIHLTEHPPGDCFRNTHWSVEIPFNRAIGIFWDVKDAREVAAYFDKQINRGG